ncbi:MAG: hypothetical protein KGO03_14715, partial [Gemmatimonadota bacterium]|nr:hypothetical protein [Gemmatimonadota bacterium]
MRFRELVRVGAACALVFAQLAAFTGAPSCPCDAPDMASMPGMPGADMHHVPAKSDMHHRAPCSLPMAPGECSAVASCAAGAVIARPP